MNKNDILARVGLVAVVAFVVLRPGMPETKNVPMTTIPTVVSPPIPESTTGCRLKSDGTDASNVAHAYIASRAQDEAACIAQTRIEADGFIQKPGKIICGERSMKEAVAVCLSHYRLRKPFMNG